MAQFPRLSNREWDVLKLLLQGKSNKQIASSLGISVRTVEFHLKNIYAKFQVRSRIELILKLGNATGGLEAEKLGRSTVDDMGEVAENRDRLNSRAGWVTSFRDAVSRIGKELAMKHPLNRNSGRAGIVAGLGYLVQAAIVGLMPQTEVFSGTLVYVLEVVVIIALVATIFGLMGLHSFAQYHYGKAGTIGFWLAVIGTGLMTISTIATLLAGENSPGFGFLGGVFLGGVLFALIGYIVLGMMIWREKVLPLWGGLALILGFPLSIFLSPLGGGILFGLAWLGVGYSLSKQSPL